MTAIPVYKIEFSRDFCLTTIETWVRAEAINDKVWTKEKQPYLPYVITEKIDKTANIYYDPRGIDWVTEELIKKTKKDEGFCDFIDGQLLAGMKKVKDAYKSPQPLGLEELRSFLKLSEEMWTWFEAAWWLWMIPENNSRDVLIPESFRASRDNTQEFVPMVESVTRRSLAVLFPEIKDYVHVLRLEEIQSGEIPERSELDARSKGYFSLEDKLFVGVDRNYIEDKYQIKFEDVPINPNSREISGQSAFGGKVRGTVKVIYSARENDHVAEGDVLVSTMTLPDYLPAMKRASAFVTDEGGVVCHAAIMAREMRKPCIVGTKIATKVLKDGMMVEVDAERGIVTIIKKNQ